MNWLNSGEQGGALLIALCILLVLTIAAIMAVDTAQTDIELSFNNLNSSQAFYVAEAGVNRALAQLNEDNDWNTGYVDMEFERGTYWVAIVDSFVDPTLFDTIIIQSTSHMEEAVANVWAWAVPEYEYPFQWAVFSDLDISLGNNTCTDSYNSDSGSYSETVDTLGGDIASNGTITLDQIADVSGDVSSAVDGGIDIGLNATVTGDTVSAVAEHVLDPIPQEDFDWAESMSLAPIGFTGDYSYDPIDKSLDVGANEKVVLSGGVYYFSSITLDNNAVLEVAEGEHVIIYMTDSLILNEASSLNAGHPPPSLAIFSSGGVYTLGQDTEISAAFYGPEAELLLENSCEVYGSILANQVDMENIACVHYDRALRDLRGGKTGEITMIAWREL